MQLDMLHKRGIYHLDISADNIVLCFPKSEDALEVAVEDIRVYIIDFGSARFASGIDLEVRVVVNLCLVSSKHVIEQ